MFPSGFVGIWIKISFESKDQSLLQRLLLKYCGLSGMAEREYNTDITTNSATVFFLFVMRPNGTKQFLQSYEWLISVKVLTSRRAILVVYAVDWSFSSAITT